MAAAQSQNDLTVLPGGALLVGHDAVTVLTNPVAGKHNVQADLEGGKEWQRQTFDLCQQTCKSALTLYSIILSHRQPLYLSPF